MNYLKYIEHSAENLQFFLWYRDYCARWDQLPESERKLSPEWTPSDAEAASARFKKPNVRVSQVHDADFSADLKAGTGLDKPDLFDTPPKSPSIDERHMAEDGSLSGDEKTLATTHATRQTTADQAFEDSGMKWKPCMPINTYLSLATAPKCFC